MTDAEKGFSGGGATSEPSKFDKFFGQHFKSLVVGVLILVLIVCFTIVYAVSTELKSEVVALFSSAIMGLIGFFAGSTSR